MTREEFENWVDEPEDNVQDTVDTLFEYVRQLQKENEELQARIKELEANEDKLKREWYTIGSDDNYKALLKSGKLKQ